MKKQSLYNQRRIREANNASLEAIKHMKTTMDVTNTIYHMMNLHNAEYLGSQSGVGSRHLGFWCRDTYVEIDVK